MSQVVTPETFTVFVNPATPINELMEGLVRATGCRMGNVDVPWSALGSKVSAYECSSVEMNMRLAVSCRDHQHSDALEFLGAYEGGNWRPANARELIVFLMTLVDEQLKHPVVALGETDDLLGHIVAYAYKFEDRRMIFIGRPSDTCKWEAGCRFLVVKK